MNHNILMPIMNFMTRYYHRSEHNSRLHIFSGTSLKTNLLLLLFAGVLFLNACEEKPTMIGKDILPGTDFVSINSADTFNIVSYTMYDYPERSEAQKMPFIGNYYDPYFGTTTSEFVSQLRLEKEWVKREYNVDSVKLVLRIVSVYGNADVFRQLRITEISKQLYNDSAYYSNSAVDTTDFGLSVDIPPLRSDTINRIEVNLPPTFGEYLIRDQDQLFYYSTSTDDFRSYFKGIYMRLLSVSDSDPLLLGLDVGSAASLGEYTNYIVVYMHDRDDNEIKTSFRFLLDPFKENASFLRVRNDFSTASPDKKFDFLINNPVLDTMSYLQGLRGVYTKLIIPGLEKIKNDASGGKIAINKARLFVPVYYDGENYTSSKLPGYIYLRYMNSVGVKEIIPDFYIDEYHNYFGGSLDTTSNSYKFNISNFIQDYLNDKNGLLKPELEIFQSLTEVRNVILKANDSKTPVKLELTYTQF